MTGEGVIPIAETMQPHALFLQRLEEALDHPVLLRRVRRDVFDDPSPAIGL
jgi:hypothetical protein